MQLVGRLDHPNIVRAFDADEIGRRPLHRHGVPAGADLDASSATAARSRPAEVGRLRGPGRPRGWPTPIARGVVHRDIKPSNLMLDDRRPAQDPRLRRRHPDGRRSDDPDAEPTGDGMAVGTVEYMSPEQARGGEVDGRSDLYSLGCVMYHLLTGRVPFPGTNKLVCLAVRIDGRPTPIDELRPGLPPGLADVVDRLMAPRPEDRYPDAAAALARASGPCRRGHRRDFSPVGSRQAWPRHSYGGWQGRVVRATRREPHRELERTGLMIVGHSFVGGRESLYGNRPAKTILNSSDHPRSLSLQSDTGCARWPEASPD